MRRSAFHSSRPRCEGRSRQSHLLLGFLAVLLLLMVLLISHHLANHLFIQASELASDLATGGSSLVFGTLRPAFLLLSYD